jgi:hypothetical protein
MIKGLFFVYKMGKQAKTDDCIKGFGGKIKFFNILEYNGDVFKLRVFGSKDLNHLFSIIDGGDGTLGAYGLKQERDQYPSASANI